ncbi:MAG: flagellin [Candidatus Zixiibacteriota bacterium]
MALRINHNLTALNAHRNLVNSTSDLSSSMEKLSSGFRINKGADNPAGLIISEQFRAQIAGLNQAIENSEGSVNMIQTAEGALTEMSNLLISMRELAIHAANEGMNDANQLAADQAEIDNAIETIDRVAATTQFGTKKLLDGSKANVATITSVNTSKITIKESNLTDGTHSISATKTADSSATLNTTSLGLSLANTDGDPASLAEKVYNLDVVQASDAAKKTSDSITMADAFGNNLTLATTAGAALISSAAALPTLTASHAGTYTVVFNYQENGEAVTGEQTIQVSVVAGDDASTVAGKFNTQISLNTALAGKIIASGTAGAGNYLRFSAANAGAQYSIKTNASSTDATTAAFTIAAQSSRGKSGRGLSITATTVKNSSVTQTVTVASGTYSSLSSLVSALDTALLTAFGTVSGGTISDIDAAVVNTNQIQFLTRDEGSDYKIKLNAVGGGTGDLENVLNFTPDTLALSGTDALVRFDGYTNTITGVKYGATGEVTLGNKAPGTTGRGTVKLTVGTGQNGGVNVGNMLLDVSAARFSVRLDGGPATTVTAGFNTTIFNADRSESVIAYYDLASPGGTETINNVDQSLVFQVGPNVGQTVRIGVPSMSSSSLAKNLAGNMFTSLSEIDITTAQGAQDAQSVIDAAIDEVTSIRGTLGSFQKNTLESNLRNLQIASQNLTAAESRIRDTDMAKEISEFTKNQVLLQTGTAMLAQANQIPQIVLSLFA